MPEPSWNELYLQYMKIIHASVALTQNYAFIGNILGIIYEFRVAFVLTTCKHDGIQTSLFSKSVLGSVEFKV